MDIAITLSCCMYVCGYITLARQNDNSWSEWLESWHSSSAPQSVKAYWFWVQ